MKRKRWISILCCMAMMFTLLGSNASAAESWNQSGEGVIVAAETAEDLTVTSESQETEIELNNVYIIKYDTSKKPHVLKNIPVKSIEADPTVFVTSEDFGSLQGTTISGIFLSSSPITTFTVSNPVYHDTDSYDTNGLWNVTKNPKDNNGEFELSMVYSVKGAIALTLDVATINGTEKTYTLVFENRRNWRDLEKLSLLSGDEYVSLCKDMKGSDSSADTTRIIYNVDADTNVVVAQLYRKIAERDEEKKSLNWMKTDQNYVSINGSNPVRFDNASSDDTEACSPELHLKKGVNVISLFFRDVVPKTYAFGRDSRGLYFTDANNYRGYQNYIYLVTYDGEEKEAEDPSDDALLSSIEVTQFSSSNNNPPQVAYPSKVEKNGYEHSIALPEGMPFLEDQMYVYGTTPAGIIHETIVLGLKTKDPYAKAEVIDAGVSAPDGADIFDNKTNTTAGAMVSMIDGAVYGGQYTAVNVWNKDEIQVTVTAADGSEKIHTIKIVRTSSAADITELEISGGTLALEDTKYVTFSSGTYEYYLDVNQETIDNNALSFTVNSSSGASINVDNKDVQAGVVTLDASLSLHKIIVTAADGITQNTYLFLTRVGQEVPLFKRNDETKTYADKMLEGWNSRTNTEKKDLSDSYWELYKTIATMDPAKDSTQRDVLKTLAGSNVYDVTEHNFRQATDYAAVILELVMLGENPYDYRGVNYVQGLLEEEEVKGNGNFGAWGNNVWTLMGLKAAGAEIPDALIQSVKKQALNSSGDLDMRGWAMAAAVESMEPLEIAKLAASIENTQLKSGDEAGMFKHPSYDTINTMTHGCVLTGIAGAGIDVQNSLYTVNGTTTPLTALKNNYMTEDGQFYYGIAGLFESYSKDVIIALGDILHGSNVWQRYELTPEKFGELLASAATMAKGSDGSEAERTAVSDALTEAQTAASTSGGAISSLGDEYYALYEAMAVIDTGMKANVIVGSPLEQFNDMIQALPDPEKIKLEDQAALEKARKSYEALPQNYQERVDSDILKKYRNCQGALILQESGTESKAAFELILALPDALIITLDDKAQVKEARKSYDALTSIQKEWITWAGTSVLSMLTDAEKMIKDLEDPGSTVKTTTVTFSLLGGSKHGDDGKIVYVYAKNPKKYDVWIPKTTYTFNSRSVTVYQVFMRAINEYRLDQKGAQKGYVSSIKGPDGEWLAEKNNGANSGWMYVVNGTHPNVGLQDCNVTSGDKIVWHYTDDYTQEEGSEHYPKKPKEGTKNKVSETVSLQAKTDASGKATASVSTKRMSEALDDVLKALKTAGKEKTVPEIKLDIKAESTVKSVETTIPTSSVKAMTKEDNMALTVVTPVGNVSFDGKALSAISDKASGNEMKITVGKADKKKLSETQQKAVSDRPVYELNLTSGNQTISDFNGGKVSVSLPYTLAVGEKAENICIYYVDEGGKLVSIENAKYDKKTGCATFITKHFSYYVIGYHAGDKFSDVKSNHWFYDNVMYLVGKGIIKGKSDTSFAPNDRITRAEFVQILYGLAQAEAGITGSAITLDSVKADGAKAEAAFGDVKSSLWYAKAVAWAHENGVVTGISGRDGTLNFAPNANISRQDMAVMIKNFTDKVEKKSIKATAQSVVFADSGNIAAYAKDAVSLMQQGGIINGMSKKNDSGDTVTAFLPKNHATRAEAATMIAKLLKTR